VAQTLSKGIIKPETGDTGDVWFPALGSNAEIQNDHTHDGITSRKIASSSVETTVDNITQADFSIEGTEYRATLNLPIGSLIATTRVSFRDPTTKEMIYPRIAFLSSTSIYVFLNEPLDLEVLY